MKRRYMVISSFFVAVFLLGVFCYASSSYSGTISGKEADSIRQGVLISQMVSNANQKITSDTKYIVEVYNADTEEFVREERAMPAEFAGMTRTELEEYLKQYKKEMEEEEAEEGLESIQLESFSKEELILQKTYREPEEETGFYLRFTEDGEVGVYKRDGKTLYEKTGIKKERIPVEEVRRLENGYVVENEKELYSILENFSS